MKDYSDIADLVLNYIENCNKGQILDIYNLITGEDLLDSEVEWDK